jgi:hypothetical protein
VQYIQESINWSLCIDKNVYAGKALTRIRDEKLFKLPSCDKAVFATAHRLDCTLC